MVPLRARHRGIRCGSGEGPASMVEPALRGILGILREKQPMPRTRGGKLVAGIESGPHRIQFRRDALPTAAGLRISERAGRLGGKHPGCRRGATPVSSLPLAADEYRPIGALPRMSLTWRLASPARSPRAGFCFSRSAGGGSRSPQRAIILPWGHHGASRDDRVHRAFVQRQGKGRT